MDSGGRNREDGAAGPETERGDWKKKLMHGVAVAAKAPALAGDMRTRPTPSDEELRWGGSLLLVPLPTRRATIEHHYPGVNLSLSANGGIPRPTALWRNCKLVRMMFSSARWKGA